MMAREYDQSSGVARFWCERLPMGIRQLYLAHSSPLGVSKGERRHLTTFNSFHQ